jgi:hypothetical protein
VPCAWAAIGRDKRPAVASARRSLLVMCESP